MNEVDLDRNRRFAVHQTFAPGGTDLSTDVIKEMSRSYVNPWSSEFISFYEETLGLLKKLYNTKQDVLVMIGPIRAAMDAVVCSILEPGEKVLVCVNGYWSELFVEIVKAHGGIPIVLQEELGTPINPDVLRKALDQLKGEIRAVIANHVETSTGVVNQVEEMGRLIKERGLIYVLDCAQSLGGMEVRMDEWGVDFCLGGNHKCMSAPAGLAYIGISREGWRFLENRKTSIKGWYSDLLKWRETWIERTRVWYTFPASLLFGLRGVLDIMFEKTPERVYQQYRLAAKAIRYGVSEMGLQLLPDGTRCPGCDSPMRLCADTATPICYPTGVSHDQFANFLNEKFNVAIGGGLGPLAGKTFRVGPTGLVQIQPSNVLKLLSVIGMGMKEMGVRVNTEAGFDAARQILNSGPSFF
jgi:alanine-glyoxylate transaminase/serine-glyoxylate transaminase/serine-pyruvate transaminase